MQEREPIMSTADDKEKITVRVPLAIARKLQAAADLTGSSLNHFLVEAALEKANRLMEREKTIPFTAEDAALFIRMLEHPPVPNPALNEAFARHK